MIPNVLALSLEEARRLLEEAGFRVRVSETRPPRAGEGHGVVRVVRQRREDDAVLLTVTHERYDRPEATPRSRAETPPGSR